MIGDTATPWVEHDLIEGTWKCRRCGVELYPGDNLLYKGAMYSKDGRTSTMTPFGKYKLCRSLEK